MVAEGLLVGSNNWPKWIGAKEVSIGIWTEVGEIRVERREGVFVCTKIQISRSSNLCRAMEADMEATEWVA